jgi:hypothetical protein
LLSNQHKHQLAREAVAKWTFISWLIKKGRFVRIELFRAVTMKNVVFWDVNAVWLL